MLLEAAHLDPPSSPGQRGGTSCPARRAALRAGGRPGAAAGRAERAAQLLVEHGGGTIAPAAPTHRRRPGSPPVPMPLELPDRVAGVGYPSGRDRPPAASGRVRGGAVRRTTGAVVAAAAVLAAGPLAPADLVEEVLRLEGFDAIPSVLPPAPPGRGLTAATPPPRGVAGAGRARVRRGAAVPVRRPRRLGRARAACRRRAAPRCGSSTRSTPTARR